MVPARTIQARPRREPRDSAGNEVVSRVSRAEAHTQL